jgi:hypothetical protein
MALEDLLDEHPPVTGFRPWYTWSKDGDRARGAAGASEEAEPEEDGPVSDQHHYPAAAAAPQQQNLARSLALRSGELRGPQLARLLETEGKLRGSIARAAAAGAVLRSSASEA